MKLKRDTIKRVNNKLKDEYEHGFTYLDDAIEKDAARKRKFATITRTEPKKGKDGINEYITVEDRDASPTFGRTEPRKGKVTLNEYKTIIKAERSPSPDLDKSGSRKYKTTLQEYRKMPLF